MFKKIYAKIDTVIDSIKVLMREIKTIKDELYNSHKLKVAVTSFIKELIKKEIIIQQRGYIPCEFNRDWYNYFDKGSKYKELEYVLTKDDVLVTGSLLFKCKGRNDEDCFEYQICVSRNGFTILRLIIYDWSEGNNGLMKFSFLMSGDITYRSIDYDNVNKNELRLVQDSIKFLLSLF